MVWLLIIFCLAVVMSPLLWMKSSPRQRQIAQCREVARSLALNVSLHRRPDARDSEQRLDMIFYWLRWKQAVELKPWVLHRFSRRGWESSYQGWRWISGQASLEWEQSIALAVSSLPSGVSAILVNGSGVGVLWDERGDAVAVHKIHNCIETLRKKGEEICC